MLQQNIKDVLTNSTATVPSQTKEERTIRFRTSLRNTVCDVMIDRGWKETDRYKAWLKQNKTQKEHSMII
ncbi:hypothetical protein HMI56_004142 [Coelomomyces lativittatus]|nr:hypothetical protein HMI56_004142 [Coelomomyces lativittatus]